MANLKNLTINDTGFLGLPSGTTAQRPASPTAGMIRYNTTLSTIEFYNGSAWANYTTILGLTESAPAANAAEILTYYPNATDGDYWYKPNGYGSAIKCYTNFSNAPSGKGYVMIARGRESTDWWNNAGQNTGNDGLAASNLTTNTPIAVSPATFVDALIGGRWDMLKMLLNRRNAGDSFYFEGRTATSAFNWSSFNANSSDRTTTVKKYSNLFRVGTLQFDIPETTLWTDTLSTSGYGVGNSCDRTFTWTWAGHQSPGGTQFQGWSGGSSCTPAGSIQVRTTDPEGHAIQLVNVYVIC
jgi:hypothetical protein